MDLNKLMKEVEARGMDWNDALAKIKEETKCKDIAAAMKEGWKVKDFAKLLLGDDAAGTQEKETPPGQPPSEDLAQPETQPPVSHSEAPASLNTYYISPGGYRWQLTIRPGLSAKEMITLLEQAGKAEEWLKKKGYTPYVPFKGNGASAPQAGGNGGEPETKICPLHHVPMKRRTGKGGDVWYSHRAVNPETNAEYWCRGKAK